MTKQDVNGAWWNFRHKLHPWFFQLILWAGAGKVLVPQMLGGALWDHPHFAAGTTKTPPLNLAAGWNPLLLLHYSHYSPWSSLLGCLSSHPASLHSRALPGSGTCSFISLCFYTASPFCSNTLSLFESPVLSWEVLVLETKYCPILCVFPGSMSPAVPSGRSVGAGRAPGLAHCYLVVDVCNWSWPGPEQGCAGATALLSPPRKEDTKEVHSFIRNCSARTRTNGSKLKEG